MVNKDVPYYDVIVLGAGFSGIYLIHHLRKLGFKCHIFEKAPEIGGTWYWNRYPGARVDSDVPVYELSIPEVYETWTWSERFPGWEELRQYFAYCDKVLNISADVDYNTTVVEAVWGEKSQTWEITTSDGRRARAQFFLPCIGFSAKRFTPDFRGLDSFKGEVYHSNDWPEEGVELTNKRVAIIGTGSTGVQITQEAGKVAKELTVFQRTPNLALPMQQRRLDLLDQDKSRYPELFESRNCTFSGFHFNFVDRNTFDDTPEEREQFYQSLFDYGGFKFWVATYRDLFSDKDANDAAYDFWYRQAHKRINDPEVAEILAPRVAPHPFGTKRPSLEQDYFEQFNKPNVHVVDVNKKPLVRFTENGVVAGDQTYVFDVLVLATGFDAVTGGYKLIDIIGEGGVCLRDKWAKGTSTYLGLSVAGFPNMFFTYGPQAPTAFSNGPSCIELQSNFIIEVMKYMRQRNIRSINADQIAENEWADEITASANKTLFPLAKSWYMGANIPGKKIEMLNFTSGITKYAEIINGVTKESYSGYVLA
ncbi:FAD/NAD(P)-binding domain-protein [Lipomyces arxii]|uniref:FAD/NAD(P)-binding domain-protein n=1 Tax=Lipomyces arxii TaxID=56418 RepID=UPI0034CEE91C